MLVSVYSSSHILRPRSCVKMYIGIAHSKLNSAAYTDANTELLLSSPAPTPQCRVAATRYMVAKSTPSGW